MHLKCHPKINVTHVNVCISGFRKSHTKVNCFEIYDVCVTFGSFKYSVRETLKKRKYFIQRITLDQVDQYNRFMHL